MMSLISIVARRPLLSQKSTIDHGQVSDVIYLSAANSFLFIDRDGRMLAIDSNLESDPICVIEYESSVKVRIIDTDIHLYIINRWHTVNITNH